MTSLHAEAIADTQAKEKQQHDTEDGLDGRDNLKPSRQA